jgi:hypothetical protein
MANKEHRPAIELLHDPDVHALSPIKVAELLGLAKSTVLEAIRKTGEVCPGVPAVKVSARTIRIPSKALREALGVRHPI